MKSAATSTSSSLETLRQCCLGSSRIDGVAKVLTADDDVLSHGIAENVAPLIQSLASGYTHLMAPATTTGKNIMPRVAALLDVMQVSDIIAVESADTFRRPIYAGNAMPP